MEEEKNFHGRAYVNKYIEELNKLKFLNELLLRRLFWTFWKQDNSALNELMAAFSNLYSISNYNSNGKVQIAIQRKGGKK